MNPIHGHLWSIRQLLSATHKTCELSLQINRYLVPIWSYNYFRFRARPWHHLSCLTSRGLFSSVSSWTLKVAHWVLAIICLQPFSRNFILLLLSLLSLNFILATAILDFWSMSNVDVTRYRKWHHWKSLPENMGIAVGILLPCALELEICLAVKYPHLPANVAKKTNVAV